MRIVALGLFVTLACGTGCQSQAPPEVEWPEFGRSLLQNAQAKDIPSLVKQSATLADAKRMWRAFQANDSSLEDLNPKIKEADIAISNQRAVSEFLELHAETLDGEPAVIGIDDKSSGDAKTYDVIVWVKDDGKYRGLRLPTVYRSPSGLKVSDWGNLARSEASNTTSGAADEKLEAESIEECKSRSKLAYDLVPVP